MNSKKHNGRSFANSHTLNQAREISSLIDRLNEGRWWSRETWTRAVLRALSGGDLNLTEAAEEMNATPEAIQKLRERTND